MAVSNNVFIPKSIKTKVKIMYHLTMDTFFYSLGLIIIVFFISFFIADLLVGIAYCVLMVIFIFIGTFPSKWNSSQSKLESYWDYLISNFKSKKQEKYNRKEIAVYVQQRDERFNEKTKKGLQNSTKRRKRTY